MNWIWDQTHRFRMRPHYSAEELDVRCEEMVRDYLQPVQGEISVPISTNDLVRMLERDVRRLELRSDLTRERGEVEVLTEFRRGQAPIVKIAAKLTEATSSENRLRAALMHAYGHIRFHGFLFQTEEGAHLSLFDDIPNPPPHTNRCNRDSILPFDDWDWMEWQAGFASGALLMPITPLITHVREFRRDRDLDHAALSDRSLDGVALIAEIAQGFQTTVESARVRLRQQRIISSGDMKSLF